MRFSLSTFALALLTYPLSAADRADVVVADFEGDSYANGWKATGTAFGKGPAKGTLPGQMNVSGYLGKGLVNSFLGGDTATGTLTSSEIKLERKYVNFLIGGGKHAKTCVNLLVGGKVVRTATGPNDRPGGTEALDWHSWDVSEFEGKSAVIEIIDDEKGGWGHINADHFVLSDKKKQAELFTSDFTIAHRYLHLPVKNGAPKRRMKFIVDKETVREFDIELDTSATPQYWFFADVEAFRGKKLVVEVVLPADSRIPGFAESDGIPDAEKVYQEKHRPLFHFTSRVGWLNDPNGLVYANGEWHLFYQHNPFGREWGNMHWGHATSKDLFRWQEQGVALYPKKYDDWAFSGSAVVDKENTSGWGTMEKPPLVLAYTSTGRGECIAYSNDNGKTWTEYEKNPVVKHVGRDPKLIWHEKAKHWVMAVYTEADKKQWIAFHTSPDLKTWTYASRIEGFFECPDLFPLPVKSKHGTGADKWVLYAADGKYLVGDFDGKEFKPDHKEKKQLWHGRFYAAQSFDNAPRTAPLFPSGVREFNRPRRVQIGWAQGVTFPGTPFNQQMTVPVELDLWDDGDGPRLRAEPVAELSGLREKPVEAIKFGSAAVAAPEAGKESRTKLADELDAFEVIAIVVPDKNTTIGLDLRGTKLMYDGAKQTLTCKDVSAPLKLGDGVLRLRVLVDRGSVEVFASGGRVALSVAAIPDEKNRKLDLVATGGFEAIGGVTVYRLKSAWGK